MAEADPQHQTNPAATNRRRVTLKHVAEASGLGVTTVSDVLNGREAGRTRYSRATREKVERVVRELGYTVDRAAQALRRGRSGVVGLLLTRHLSDAFFGLIVDRVEQLLRDRGFDLQLAIGQGKGVEERMEQVRRERVEGLIFGPAYDAEDLACLGDFAGPVVVFGAPCAAGKYDEVVIDHFAARRLVAEHLLSRGHRRVAFLELHRPKVAGVPVEADRLRAVGLTGEDWWRPDHGTQDPAVLHAAATAFADRWLAAERADRPTALMCHDDHTAAIALSALWDRGVRVPADVSVVGLNDMPTARYLVPPLTTVDLHVERQMAAAVDRLAERIADPSVPPRTVRVDPELVVRRSVRDV